MKPRPFRRLRTKTPWLVLLGVLAFGCSRLPTAPELTSRDVSGSGAVQVVVEPILPGDPGDGGGGGGGGVILPPIFDPDTLIRAEDIDGSEGGEVQAGYIEVEVPVGAYTGMAQVRITVPDDDSLKCHLEIFPASKNSFAEPVLVKFDLRHVDRAAMGVSPIQTLGVYWFNETTQRWEQIAAQMDSRGESITAELSHFSEYKVAKATQNKASW